MKKICGTILIILTVLIGSACAKVPEIVSDAFLQKEIDKYIEEYGFEDCGELTVEVEHNPDLESHLDSVDIRFIAAYPFGEYNAEVSDLVYQYDRSSKTWSVVSGGKLSDTIASLKKESLLGTYEGNRIYEDPRNDNWSNASFDFEVTRIDDDDTHSDIGLITHGYYERKGVEHSLDWSNYTYWVPQQSNPYHKALMWMYHEFWVDEDAVIIITPEKGLTLYNQIFQFSLAYYADNGLEINDSYITLYPTE